MQLLPSTLNIPILLVEHNIEYLLDLQRYLLFSSSTSNDRFRLWQEYYRTFLSGKKSMESSIKSCYAYKGGRNNRKEPIGA